MTADVHLPNNDSDYDEVASDDGEETDVDYSYPVKVSLWQSRGLGSFFIAMHIDGIDQ